MTNLRRLIGEKVVEPFGIFYSTGEGIEMPNGDEEGSGYVIDSDDRTYFYWYGWNPATSEPALTIWRACEPQPEWNDDLEYQHARYAAHWND